MPLTKTSMCILTLLVGFFVSTNAFAQSKIVNKEKAKKEIAKDTIKTAKDTTKKETLADKVKTSKLLPGLFSLYQDTVNGSLMMYVKKDQLGVEYLYQSFSMGGPPALFLNQNMLRETWLFSIRKNFDKLYWSRSNTNFYFDPKHPLSKAANVDVSETVFLTEKLVSEDSLGYLINVDNLFIGEKLDPVKPFIPPTIPASSYLNLGTLNKDKSEYLKLRSFPLNTDVVVNLSFENPNPQNFGGADITDARYINVKMQHSFLALPKNDFVPRKDHPHIGYFTVQADNMTTPEHNYYHDFINRWHLKKKNPELAISEPVEPIVWWVENTTPLEIRQTIIDAGHKWNIAFEKAGFKNAVVMKMMPDDADWDPADIRYNVIRWVSSDLGFAIGPSFVNPRTGQILGADITMDYSFMRGVRAETELFEAMHSQELPLHGNQRCMIGSGMCMQNHVAKACLEAFDADETEKLELQNQFITELVLHEMGHTMGLMHNMKSSHMLSPAELKNKELTGKYGVTGSVMDYSIVNLSLDRSKQAHYYTTTVGPYDLWVIEYGYSQFKPEEETAALNAIIKRSTDPKLIFGNDADICRPGGGIDPRVMTWDMSSDPVSYADERFQIVDNAMARLKTKFVKPDASYDHFRTSFLTLFYDRFNMSRAVANYIGGVYVDRSFPGQQAKLGPYTPVPLAEQKRVMDLLHKHVFSANALSGDQQYYHLLQAQRRGFNFFGNSEDPKLDVMVSNMYNNVLSPIMSAPVLRRMNNSSLYGNQYTVDMLFNDLNKSVFDEDINGTVSMYRKSLQQLYIGKLLEIFENNAQNYGVDTKAIAFTSLEKLRNKLKKAKGGDESTTAHRKYLVHRIEKSIKGQK